MVKPLRASTEVNLVVTIEFDFPGVLINSGEFNITMRIELLI